MYILYQNVRGLRSKLSLFKKSLLNTNAHLIAVTETFLVSSVYDGELFPRGYTVYRQDRANDAGAGGVLLAVRDTFSSRRITNIDGLTAAQEVLFVLITYKNIKFLCCVVYLPPNYNNMEYIHVLQTIENAICKLAPVEVVVIGDFNLNSVSTYVREQFEYFLNFCKLTQFNTIPNHHGGILDFVLSGLHRERVCVVRGIGALVPEDCYHPTLEVSVRWPSRRSCVGAGMPSLPLSSDPAYVLDRGFQWNFRKADINVLYASFAEIDWSDIVSETDVNIALNTFYNKLYSIIDYCVPTKRCIVTNQTNKYPTWFTSEIIQNLRFKHFNHKRYKAEGKEVNLELFKYYRSRIKYLMETAYKKYLLSIERDIGDNPKIFWKFIKDKRQSRHNCNKYYDYLGKPVEGQYAADAFATYFSSVFLADEPKLDPTEAQHSAAITSQFCSSARVALLTVDNSDLRCAVKRIKPFSASGPDRIPSFLAKDCISVLSVPLLHIYNLSLQMSTYPSTWKHTRVTPVFKGGDRTDVKNYRPIAVLSVFAKIFESIINKHVSAQIRNQLTDSQHGFRAGRSTATNHINFVNYVAAEMDAGKQVDAVYLDFEKAFDRVDNDVLLMKFASFGFTPKLLKLFSSYLSDRSQHVELAGFKSKTYFTRSGVSQGSTLGPTQFLIMINDLSSILSERTKCLMFADDLKLYVGVGCDAEHHALQRDITRVAEWGERNRLHFNTNKCKVVAYSRSRSPVLFPYHLSGVILNHVAVIRDLGVIFDSKLTFKDHIQNICKRGSGLLGFIIRQTHDFVGHRVIVMLYDAYLRSSLEYNALVWDPREAVQKLMLEKLHKKFCRFLFKKMYGYYPFLYPSLYVTGMVGLDTLELRRKMTLMVHYYQLLHNKIDNSTALESVSLYVPDGYMRGCMCGGVRRQRQLLSTMHARTQHTANSPTHRAVSLLNGLLAYAPEMDIFHDGLQRFIVVVRNYLS